MKTKEIYNLAVRLGKKADFRGEKGVKKFLERKKKIYDSLPKSQKEDFDKDSLTNPYMDSGVLNIEEDKEIKKVLVGIDIEPAEILLAKELKDIDLVISHHPLGKGLAHLADVMDLQSDVLNFYGVPINIAERLMKERISEVARGINVVNHQRTVDTSKLLKFNLMNVHTPCDNLAADFLRKEVEGKDLERVEDLLSLLKKIPEYQKASKIGAGPKIYVGSPNNRCGKIAFSEITGGTEGSAELYEKMAQSGIGTVVGMHISENNRKKAESANLNIVIAGHISSDSLGMNIFLDKLEEEGIEIVPCSGLIRISRK